MFFASTGALGCSFYRIFRVQQANTGFFDFLNFDYNTLIASTNGASIPDSAVYIAAAAMAIGTGSIAVR